MRPNEKKAFEELKARLAEAEETLRAIREGEVDAVVVRGHDGEHVYTLEGAESSYRHFLEQMQEGAATINLDGRIVFANRSFAQMFGLTLHDALGIPFERLLPAGSVESFRELLKLERHEPEAIDVRLKAKDGSGKPLRLSFSPITGDGQDTISVVAVDLSEREALREAIRAEKYTRNVLNSLHTFAAVLSVEGLVIDVNETALRKSGIQLEDVLGRHAEDTIWWSYSPEGRHFARSVIAQAARGEVVQGDARLGSKDGFVHIDFVVAPMRDAQGKITHLIASGIDITQRKRAEEQRASSEQRLRKFFESDMIGSIFWNMDGYIYDANDKFLNMVGYGREELRAPGISWIKMTPPEYRELDEQAIKDLKATGVDTPYEKEYIRKDGSRISVLVGAAMLDEKRHDGFAFVLDITKRKQAEKALRESEARFRALFDHSADAVFLTVPEGQIVAANPAACAMFWMSEEEICRAGRAGLVDPEDPRHAAAMEERRRCGRIVNVEVSYRRKNGETFPAEVSSVILSREPPSAFVIVRDVTNRKRFEDELRAARTSAETAKQAAENANAAKDQFLAVLSHELRTPLTPVLAAVQLMQRTGELSEGGRRHVEIIRRNLELEARLIDDLLDLTRIVRGKISLERKSINICTIIERVVETCRPDIEARNLHFGVKIDCPPHSVNGDTSRLQQVFWNLLKNSIKFTPDGGCVSIRCFRADGQAVVEVMDSGIGIEPDMLSRIFDVFEQGDRRVTRQFGGLGLGLAITKRIVELHGGTVAAESPGRDQGATFRVTLPIITAEAEAQAGRAAAEPRSVAGAASRRILLVEDHGDSALMMQALLESEGYQVKLAGDVKQALAAVASGHFDLMISDLGLPDQSGLELIQELRRRGSSLKAIALSGYGREDDVKRSREAGFSEHLTKPVAFDALMVAVDRNF